MRNTRENIIQLWFEMWLKKEDLGISDIFSNNAIYIESWGPVYQSSAEIKLWFDEWNRRGCVEQWTIKQYFHRGDQTIVEWFFKSSMQDGATDEFDGMSLIQWTCNNKIVFLKEYGCNIHRYYPYQNGSATQYKNEEIRWF